jgi:hypothetical protein
MWRGAAPRAVACVLAGALVSACASTVELATPPLAKRVPAGWATPLRAQLREVAGAPCFREEVVRYLGAPGGLQLAATDDRSDLVLTGALTRLEVHSNRGDKQAALLYFSAFVITAPIAAVMYGAKDWHADAAADGELAAADPSGTVLWRKTLTVSVSESQRTMPSAEALETAMTRAVCQKLAATLLNSLAEHLASSHPQPR